MTAGQTQGSVSHCDSLVWDHSDESGLWHAPAGLQEVENPIALFPRLACRWR